MIIVNRFVEWIFKCLKFYLEEYKEARNEGIGWFYIALTVFFLVVLVVLVFGVIWIIWYSTFMSTHHCITYSASYWTTDHYGLNVLTRDCKEWSK